MYSIDRIKLNRAGIMKNKCFFTLILTAVALLQITFLNFEAQAVKKSGSLSEDEVTKVEENIETLNKKIHTMALFSPEDSEKLVEIKTKLNSIADGKIKDPLYARLFYEAAFIMKEREQKQDSIQYFLIVAKNFPESMYSKRAHSELKNFGVELNKEEDSED